MKLLRLKKIFADETQLFHLVEKAEWRQQEGWHDKLLNFHILTFCGIDRVKKRDDDYIPYEKKKHSKKICALCYKNFRLKK